MLRFLSTLFTALALLASPLAMVGGGVAMAFGGWAETVDKTADFAPALDRAMEQKGIRLIHCKTEVEQITNATTISKIREKAGA